MRRYWIPETSQNDTHVLIAGDEFHHICDVCRQSLGSKFEVLTEDGWALLVEIENVGKKQAVAKVLEKRKIPELPKPFIHLALSVPKASTFESVLEKSVELGVHTIWPFYSDFSFVKTKRSFFENKSQRLQRIIKSATQQTGRGELLHLQSPQNLEELLQQYQKESNVSGVFAYEGEGDGSLQKSLKNSNSSEHLWLFVGSEGGFSEREVELFRQINLSPVSLGQQVLRVETACVTLLSIIKYELKQFH